MSAYIRPENRDTRYDLWHVGYEVRAPYIRTLSIEDLEENGLPTSGDPHHDHAMQWEPKLMLLPIHRMVDYWRQGVNISLVNKDDAVKIYKAITAHLFAWKDHIENSFHPIEPPTEDLLALDQFATIVYDHAKLTYNQTFVAKHLKINSSTAVGRKALLDAMAKADEVALANKASDRMVLTKITHVEATPAYNPNSERQFIDYSGTSVVSTAPSRKSLSSFFKK